MRGRADLSYLVRLIGPGGQARVTPHPSGFACHLLPQGEKESAPLMQKIAEGEIDPGFRITHKIKLEDGPDAYRMFQEKTDGCIKVVINP